LTAWLELPAGSAPVGDLLTGLGVALGGGLLIGLERERRKGRGPDRQAAGIRSFTLVALGGAIAQALRQPALVAVGALAVVVLAALAYWRSAGPPRRDRNVERTPAAAAAEAARRADPGLTTELAMVVTYLVGVLAMDRPALGAGAAAVVALLLAARGSLHRFATRLLSEQELHDGLLLAGLALVLMPLVPQQPVPWLAGLQPSVLAALVLLILLLQAAGHMALRLAGPGAGLSLAGLMSGFVSSTATIASMGARLRASPMLTWPCTAGALLSTAATWLQATLMLLALAPSLMTRLLPALGTGAAIALALGGAAAWRGRRDRPRGDWHAAGGALQVRQALLVAALLTLTALAVHQASQHFGQTGALATAALAGLGDAHAGVAAMGALAAQQRLEPALAAAGVLVTVGANSISRSVVALVSGGRRFGLRVAAGLFASLAGAAAVALATGSLHG